MSNNILRIGVIAGSTRQNRFSDKPATWIHAEANKREGVEAELLDLRDWPLPFFDEPMGPSQLNGKYSNELAQKWAGVIAGKDAYIVVTPEYNHGVPAVLKNAIDWLFPEWANKPVGFVSYGSAGGARSVEHLRQIAVEIQMASVRNAVHIPGAKFFPILMGKAPWEPEKDESLMNAADAMLTQLLWWGRALKEAREKTA
jgi:NAD(P)H-dependent FMN reductase